MKTPGLSMLTVLVSVLTQTAGQAQQYSPVCNAPIADHCMPAEKCAPNTCAPNCNAPSSCAPNLTARNEACDNNDCCTPQSKKVCRIVCSTKRVKKFRWECQSKDICLPGRSRSVEECKQNPCTGPGCQEACCDNKTNTSFFSRFQSKKKTVPTCGKIRTVKKLIRVEYWVEVPVYKCEVVTVPCADGCGPECATGNCAPGLEHGLPPTAPEPQQVHPAPAVDAAIFSPGRLFKFNSIRNVSHSSR